MLLPLTNTPRDYAWGSRTAIAELLGRQPSGGPEAELWLGAHPVSPSRVANPDGTETTLDRVIEADPAKALGRGRTRLPFLLKILAADQPLSLQVHPDTEQARAGFARENAAGLALDAPERNYRDDSAKPELILALSERFEALTGFRHLSESRVLFGELKGFAAGDDADALAAFTDRLGGGSSENPVLPATTGGAADVHGEGDPGHLPAAEREQRDAQATPGNPLRDTVAWLLTGDRGEVERLVRAVAGAAGNAPEHTSFGREWELVRQLADAYPGDPGVVLSLLLNRVTLVQGQAMFLKPGSIHAYLSGVGVELMSSSDNVLRGGLTSKHVDPAALLEVVRFEQQPARIITPDQPVEGIGVYRTDGDEFVLARIDLGDAGYTHGYRLTGPDSAAFALTGPAIALALTGGVTVAGATGSVALGRGDAVFLSPDEQEVLFSGSGTVVVATTP
jgi:mannose-6-phosphate isomerase